MARLDKIMAKRVAAVASQSAFEAFPLRGGWNHLPRSRNNWDLWQEYINGLETAARKEIRSIELLDTI